MVSARPPKNQRAVHSYPGLFVVLESAEEGAGKSTLACALNDALTSQGHNVVLVREPGSTPWGEELRSALLFSPHARPAEADLFAMNSARAALVAHVIRPALADGGIVLCDRYTMSSLAYQGEAWGLGFDYVQQVCDLATRGLRPDITLFLELSPEEAERRRVADRRRGDYFENSSAMQRARAGYRRAVAEDPTVIPINADVPAEQVLQEALLNLAPHLP